MPKLLGLLLLILAPLSASALDVPHYFSSGRTGFYAQALGDSCFTIDLDSDSLPCNPAYMAKARDREFKAQILAGDNVSYLNDAVDLAKGHADSNTVHNLFGSQASSELQASLEATYMAETFGISYDPYRINYYSQFRNPALPEITLLASFEESARVQVASYAFDDFYAGLQLRYLHREIIASRFFLTDVLAESRNAYLTPADQKYVFFEPGFLYSREDNPLRPEVSLNLVNFGYRSGDSSVADPVPEFHLGAGISPDVGWGRWGFAVDANWNRDIDDPMDSFTLGSYYEIGILNIFASLGKEATGAGFNVHFGNFNAGLSYLTRTEKLDDTESISSHRLYFLLGATI